VTRFGPDADQAALVDAVRDRLADLCPTQCDVGTDEKSARQRWEALAELGLLGLCAPEHAGGLAADETSMVLALEECGRAALPEPVAEVAAVAVPLLADLGVPAGLLPDILAGNVRPAVGLPGERQVLGAASADLLLLADSDSDLHLLPAGDAEVRQASSESAGAAVGDVEWRPTRDTPLAHGPVVADALRAASDRGALGTAAVLAGLAAGMVDLAVDYAKTRTQFGRPIGANQAVKHRLADAHLAVTFARPLVHQAAWALADGQPTASRDVSAAAFAAARAGQNAGRAALQVHGAIGYTREHPLHRWLAQTWMLVPLHGTPEQHRARVLDALRAGQRDRTGAARRSGPSGADRA
jgi:alkylation response protein AidB-like acyl-CoA dehydrogenase